MVDSFINLENVCEAAALMATVDTYHIKIDVLEDADDFIAELKTALENFNKPLRKNENDLEEEAYSPQLIFNDRLSALLNDTKNLYDILTDHGKEILHVHIENKKRPNNE